MIARTAKASKDLTTPFLIGVNAGGLGFIAPPPARDPLTRGLIFEDSPTFVPNMTPSEVLHAGAWGGGYFRDIYSSIIKQKCEGAWRELPADWIAGLNVDKQLASRKYNVSVNKYKVNCGFKSGSDDTFGLAAWEESGWIVGQDPYGWFQWYCRFFQGRRSPDDARQISRWLACAGPNGRWRGNLCGKIILSDASFDDPSVAPVVRQTLLHWAYTLSATDFKAGLRRVKRNGATYIPRSVMQAKTGVTHRQKSPVAAEPESAPPSHSESEKLAKQSRDARARKRSRAE